MDQSYKRLLLIVLALGAGCSRPSPSAEGGQGASDGTRIVGRYDGGVVTEAELAAESSKLPSPLHEQFESAVGQREFVRSMIDKRLLELEARRRGLHEDAAILKQVRELESRLIIQALLAAEEQRVGAPSEQTLREYYQEQRQTLAQPERVRVARVFVAVPPNATAAQRAQARQRVERFAQRLSRGEPFAKVAGVGEGPERTQGGDLGFLGRGEGREPALEKAAFALDKPGAVSPVVSESGGFSVLQLLERREARIPPFEEVRSQIEARVLPQHKRKVFESLLARLRQAGAVEIDVPAHPSGKP
jgi:peptidyl-prolyl cis-trans isomerase C